MSAPEYPMTTWRHELELAKDEWGDESEVVAVAPDESVLDVEFDGGFGLAEGPRVLVWTEKRVYFAVTYDGNEYMGSAPRNPTTDGQGHAGGE